MVKKNPDTYRIARPLTIEPLPDGAPDGSRQRVECALCGKVGPAKVDLEGGEIRLRCLTCDGVWILTAQRKAEPPPLQSSETMAPVTPDPTDFGRSGEAPIVRFRKQTSARGSTTPTEPVERANVEHANNEPASSPICECPKCGAEVVAPAKSCGACGLAEHRFASYRKKYRSKRATEVPEIDKAWEYVMANWDSPIAHREFLENVAELGKFATAAKRYRTVLETRPGDSRAVQQVERLRKMAQAMMVIQRPPQVAIAPAPFRGRAVVMIVVIVSALALMLVFLIKNRSDDGSSVAPPPMDPKSILEPADLSQESFAERKKRVQNGDAAPLIDAQVD